MKNLALTAFSSTPNKLKMNERQFALLVIAGKSKVRLSHRIDKPCIFKAYCSGVRRSKQAENQCEKWACFNLVLTALILMDSVPATYSTELCQYKLCVSPGSEKLLSHTTWIFLASQIHIFRGKARLHKNPID